MEEDALIQRIAEGDAQAFGRLVKACQRRLVGFAARLLGDAEVQEIERLKVGELLAEVRALRAELKAVRAEMAALRRQLAARPQSRCVKPRRSSCPTRRRRSAPCIWSERAQRSSMLWMSSQNRRARAFDARWPARSSPSSPSACCRAPTAPDASPPTRFSSQPRASSSSLRRGTPICGWRLKRAVTPECRRWMTPSSSSTAPARSLTKRPGTTSKTATASVPTRSKANKTSSRDFGLFRLCGGVGHSGTMTAFTTRRASTSARAAPTSLRP